MTPAEKKATAAVVRAAKACRNRNGFIFEFGPNGYYPVRRKAMMRLETALDTLLNLEAKRKGVRRGK